MFCPEGDATWAWAVESTRPAATTRTSVQPAMEPKADPVATKLAVKELVEAPTEVKREVKLDHSLIMSEVQLLLAEKRTSYASPRGS